MTIPTARKENAAGIVIIIMAVKRKRASKEALKSLVGDTRFELVTPSV